MASDADEKSSRLGSQSYLMSDDAPARERLKLLAEVYDPLTQTFLQESNIPKNARILDFGCGAGIMALWMAREIVPDGFVIGVDMSEAHIKSANQNKEKQGAKNVEFLHNDLFESNFTSEFDLVTSRYLLMHLRDPKAAILKMSSALRPNGLIILGEGAHCKVRAEPNSEVVSKTIELSRQVASTLGVNYDIALSQVDLLDESGFDIVNVDIHDTEVFGRAKHLLKLGVIEASPRLLASKMFDEQTVQLFVDGLEKVANDENSRTFMYEFHQVLARKKDPTK